nr:5'-3' exonuclease H3TH domain-containing protein [Sessilibacter corallicola]
MLPEQWIDFQTLVGDAVDNVPGVKGIGVKTATQLLHQYGSLTGILENIEQLNTLKIRNIKNIQSQIQDNISSIAVSKILVTIEKNLTLIDKSDDIVVKPISFDGAAKFCCQMGFPNLVNRIERLIQLN